MRRTRRTFLNDPDGLRLPVKLDATTNGEFEPIPLSRVHARANETAMREATRRLTRERMVGVIRRRAGRAEDRHRTPDAAQRLIARDELGADAVEPFLLGALGQDRRPLSAQELLVGGGRADGVGHGPSVDDGLVRAPRDVLGRAAIFARIAGISRRSLLVSGGDWSSRWPAALHRRARGGTN